MEKSFHQNNELAEEAGIPKELGQPHILRHTRAIELLRAGVPVSIVQNIYWVILL